MPIDIPADTPPDELIRLLNERLREVEYAAAAANASTGDLTVLLHVSGGLSVRSSATPLVTLARGVTITQVEVMVKKAPVDGTITARLLADGLAIADFVIGAGQKRRSAPAVAFIGPGQVLSVDILTVGATFPGADLTVAISAK